MRKNASAVALAKRRWKDIPEEDRKEAARHAARARWNRKPPEKPQAVPEKKA